MLAGIAKHDYAPEAKEKCKEFFDNYKACKKEEVRRGGRGSGGGSSSSSSSTVRERSACKKRRCVGDDGSSGSCSGTAGVERDVEGVHAVPRCAPLHAAPGSGTARKSGGQNPEAFLALALACAGPDPLREAT